MTMHAPPVRFAESKQQKIEDLIVLLGARVAALAMQLRAGQLTRGQFVHATSDQLRGSAHTAAALAGRTPEGAEAVDQLLASKSEYLDGFAADIAEEKASEKQIAARALLWAGLLHTAYQMGKTAAGQRHARRNGTTIEITWLCADDTSSCADCANLMADSPYTFDTLPTYPGDGVQCGGNCRCDLTYVPVPTSGADFALGPTYLLSGGGR